MSDLLIYLSFFFKLFLLKMFFNLPLQWVGLIWHDVDRREKGLQPPWRSSEAWWWGQDANPGAYLCLIVGRQGCCPRLVRAG